MAVWRTILLVLSAGCLAAAVVLTALFAASLPIRRQPKSAPVQEDPSVCDRLGTGASELTIRALHKSLDRGTAVYEDNVAADLGRLHVACRHFEADASGKTTGVWGSGDVKIRGVPGFDAIAADGFQLAELCGDLDLRGDVRLKSRSGILKYRRCTVTPKGEVTEAVSLLDDFAGAKELQAKLVVLEKIRHVYDDNELPGEPRMLLALELLRPHLSWHSAEGGSRKPLADWQQQRDRASDWRWSPAHEGEPWMREEAAATTLQVWRIKDRRHVDVARAKKLLQQPIDGNAEMEHRRQHWFFELQRNNTAITLDIAPVYHVKTPAEVVVDVRNADKLLVKLYRAVRTRDVLAVSQRLGEDFIYRDYGRQQPSPKDLGAQLRRIEGRLRQSSPAATRLVPELTPDDLVYHLNVAVADLKPLAADRTSAARTYFGDGTARNRPRFDKLYRPVRGEASCWHCDLLLEIPAKILREPGDYILAVEANGQTDYAPVVVITQSP
jgi:hypothetical protein